MMDLSLAIEAITRTIGMHSGSISLLEDDKATTEKEIKEKEKKLAELTFSLSRQREMKTQLMLVLDLIKDSQND